VSEEEALDRPGLLPGERLASFDALSLTEAGEEDGRARDRRRRHVMPPPGPNFPRKSNCAS
jgi:hypothetical protein